MNKNFINYEMIKSNSIEFSFLSKEFGNYIQFEDSITEKIYVSVHSSQSIFRTTDFQPINIMFNKNRIFNYFQFSKHVVKSLQWPYETNCKSNQIESKTENELIYSFDDCVNSCIFDKIYAKYKCIQMKGGFKIDLILENKTNDLTFCNENITQKTKFNNLEIFCLRTCKKNCNDEYFQVHSYETFKYSNKTVVIKSANFPLLEYELNTKFSLFNYASNLGGIISMWFEFAVIDTHVLIKQFFAFLSELFMKIVNSLSLVLIFQKFSIYRFINLFIFINYYLSIFFIKAQKIHWKLLFKIFCLICFIYQSIELTSEYLLFKTLIEVKIENEVKDGYINSFPAISFCRENIPLNKSKIISLYGRRANIKPIFKDCLFDKEYNLSNNLETTNCRISYGKFVEILKNQTFVSQYLYYIDSNLFQIEYILNILFNRKINFDLSLITSHSKDLDCLTYMSKLSKKYNSSLKLKENTRYHIETNNFPYDGYLYIHDSNQLPSFPKSKLSSIPLNAKQTENFQIIYEKKSFKLLPAPYDTDCYDYNGSIKSQAQCMNEFLMREYLQNNCLPKNDGLLTFVVDNKNYTEFEYKFCEKYMHKNKKEALIIELNKCRKACNEELYDISYSKESNDITLNSKNLKYVVFEHKPGMEFNQYLVNFGGLLGLWHGLSLLDLRNSIIKLMNKIFSFKCGIKNCCKFFKIFKFPEKVRKYLTLKVSY